MNYSSETIRTSHGGAPPHRRRGTALVLVIALLGMLLVMGVAFVATVDFAADDIAIDNRNRQIYGTADGLSEELIAAIRQSLVSPLGKPLGTPKIGEAGAYAEVPGLQDTFSPLEPVWTAPYGTPEVRHLVWPSHVDMRRLNGQVPGAFNRSFADTSSQWYTESGPFQGIRIDWTPGVPVHVYWPDDMQGFVDSRYFTEDLLASESGYEFGRDKRPNEILPVDADGDNVADTLAYSIESLGFSGMQARDVSAVVNAPTNAQGRVFVGVRNVNHGGMVNLNESHPLLVERIMDREADYLHRPSALDSDVHGFYSPVLTEPLLRRRGGIVPRVFPSTQLLGDPTIPPLDRGGAPYGKGDFTAQLLPLKTTGGGPTFQTPYAGEHRYWPYLPDDREGDTPLFAMRFEPEMSLAADPSHESYDHMHLSTLVSYDDNLRHGIEVLASTPSETRPRFGLGEQNVQTGGVEKELTGESRDILELMRLANRYLNSAYGENPDVVNLPFEYANYPEDIPNGGRCFDPRDEECQFDFVKGRLKLSLPWLQDALDRGLITVQQQTQLVHDVFLMMMRMAHDDIDSAARDPQTGLPDPNFVRTDIEGWADLVKFTGETDDAFGNIGELNYGWFPNTRQQAIAAAMLTANFFDFVDSDDTPTRIPVRYNYFGEHLEPENINTSINQNISTEDLEPIEYVGRPRQNELGEFEYVYGVERQPYITEVSTVTLNNDQAACLPAGADWHDFYKRNVFWAVEILNPYNYDFDPLSVENPHQYELWTYPRGSSPNSPEAKRLTINVPLPAEKYTVISYGCEDFVQPNFVNIEVSSNPSEWNFDFIRNDWTLALVRRVLMDGPDNPPTYIIVDQFDIDDPLDNGTGPDQSTDVVGYYREQDDVAEDPQFSEDFVASLQRVVEYVPPRNGVAAAGTPWTAPVPVTRQVAEPPGEERGRVTLGKSNFPQNAPSAVVEQALQNLRVAPVELLFADTDNIAEAFPTTGSMLMLPRFANRDTKEWSLPGNSAEFEELPTKRSWTSRLAGTVSRQVPSEKSEDGYVSIDVNLHEQIDNGRMPIFDVGNLNRAESYEANDRGREFLPWGQFVFDFFTALPLQSEGPYRKPRGTDGNEFVPGRPDSLPRVDLDGLRVHGRINLNAAPWTVIAGLPLIPMDKYPETIRDRMRGALLIDQNELPDEQAGWIGERLAKSIVSYRDGRQIVYDGELGITNGTGSYADRLQSTSDPRDRKGPGFYTVGELANVRRADAATTFFTESTFDDFGRVYSIQESDFNVDRNLVESPYIQQRDFINAASLLIALGDWATVRSHVFTVYATLRGEPDPNDPLADESDTPDGLRHLIEDVDARALRFQETIDRMPMLLGQPSPTRIGKRSFGGYLDFQED